jgi:hypothetical protein
MRDRLARAKKIVRRRQLQTTPYRTRCRAVPMSSTDENEVPRISQALPRTAAAILHCKRALASEGEEGAWFVMEGGAGGH